MQLTDNFNDNLISSSTTKNVETNTSAYESTASKLPTQTTSPHHQLVNVSYTLWVGTNETYHLTVTAPKNETFYGVMLLAAEKSPHFQFSASEWPNGHYVHTLAGYKEEPMSYHYWLLYRLTSPPDLSSPPGNQLVAPGGISLQSSSIIRFLIIMYRSAINSLDKFSHQNFTFFFYRYLFSQILLIFLITLLFKYFYF